MSCPILGRKAELEGKLWHQTFCKDAAIAARCTHGVQGEICHMVPPGIGYHDVSADVDIASCSQEANKGHEKILGSSLERRHHRHLTNGWLA